MKFSVIIPVYNVERFLAKCLDSVLAQDYDDYEIVAVNDGSTDSSPAILKEYTQRDKRIRVIHQKNLGLGGARNTGISCAEGEYLFLLDSDDYIVPNALSKVAECLEKYNLDVLAFDWQKVDEAGNYQERATMQEYDEYFTELQPRDLLLFEPTGCTKVYRRELFSQHDIAYPERLWYEDLATTFKIVPHLKRLGYLKEVLYFYVQQAQSITHSRNTERMMEIIRAMESEITYYRQLNLFDVYREELEWNCFLHCIYYSAFRVLACGYKPKQMNELWSYCKNLFPNFEENKYVCRYKKARYMMQDLLEKRWWRFYWKNNLRVRIAAKVYCILGK